MLQPLYSQRSPVNAVAIDPSGPIYFAGAGEHLVVFRRVPSRGTIEVGRFEFSTTDDDIVGVARADIASAGAPGGVRPTVAVARGNSGWAIFDVSAPASPVLVASGPGNCVGVAICPETSAAVFADLTSGLRIVNALTGAPLTIFPTPGDANAVTLSSRTVLVADGLAGLHVVDLTNPAAPAALGSLDTPGNAVDVAATTANAFIADQAGGLHIVDISPAGVPMLRTTLTGIGSVTRVAYTPGALYLARKQPDGYIKSPALVDIANLSAPAIVANSNLESPYYTAFGSSGSSVYAIRADGVVYTFNTTDPLLPTISNAFNWEVRHEDIVIVGSTLYALSDDLGLQIFDVSIPGRPTLLGELWNFVLPTSVAVSGTHAFLVSPRQGLFVIDVADPSAPAQVGFLEGQPTEVALSDTIACLADTPGLRVLDVSSPAQPVELATVSMSGGARAIDVVGTTAYVAAGDYSPIQAVWIFDISTPAAPVLLGSIPFNATVMTVASDRAYLSGPGGFAIFDVSNPATPIRLGGLSQNMDAFALVDSRIIGSSNYRGHLGVIDVGDPSNPIYSGNIPTYLSTAFPNFGHIDFDSIAVQGSYVYAGQWNSGLNAFRLPSTLTPLTLSPVTTRTNGTLCPTNSSYCRRVPFGATVTYSVTATSGQPRDIQWIRGFTGTPVVNGPTPHGSIISGADTLELTITNFRSQDSGSYRLATSSADCLTAFAYGPTVDTGPCRADVNGSGTVTVADVLEFVSQFFRSSRDADFNRDGSTTVQDIFDFLTAYFAGC